MCTLNYRLNEKEFTGYKVLVEDIETGKMYSGFTGQEIVIGPVTAPDVERTLERLDLGWTSMIDWEKFKNLPFFRPEYLGKTSVFGILSETGQIMEESKPVNTYRSVIVRMRIGGELWDATYPEQVLAHVVAGTEILSMEVVDRNTLKRPRSSGAN